MEVYEQINLILEERNTTKREFAKRLISLEPKSKRTGETIREKAVYSYLNGKSVINADLIPYIADALQISEQSLFEDNEKVRGRLIRFLLASANNTEKKIIKEFYLTTLKPESYGNIIDLLPYASPSILEKIERTLLEMKSISEKI